jgi:hypothetical protein
MNTITLFTRDNRGIVIAFGVHLTGYLKDPLWAKLDAQLTALTAVRDKVYLTARDMMFPEVKRLTIEDFHPVILSI